MSDNADPYATARANLRDNVKTMATILAGTAGAIMAGSTFTGIGTLEPSSARFLLAMGGLLAVAIAFFFGWKTLTFTLRPDVVYPENLRSNVTEAQIRTLGLPAVEAQEIIDLKAEFERRHRSLLPDGIHSYEAMEALLDDKWDELQAPGAPADRSEYEGYEKNLRDVGFWASFTRLSFRVERGLRRVQQLGAAGLAGLLVFAWAANPPKPEDPTKGPVVHIVTTCASCPAGPPAPLSARILFGMNSYALDAEAYEELTLANTILRRRPEMGALLLAHTDMVAGERRNHELAAQRAQAVRQALTGQGGVAANRIFVASLPRTDLPVLTAAEVAQQKNRLVEILFVALPLPQR